MTALASGEPATTTPTVRRRGLSHVLAPLAVAVLSAVTVAAIWAFFLHTTTGQRADTFALRGGDVQHPKLVALLDRTLGNTTLITLLAVCVGAAVVGVLRKRVDLAVGAALTVLGSNASAQLLKNAMHRPNLDDFPAPNSFPSGHTAAAASVAFALILVLPQAVRATLALAGAGYVTVIAVATVWAQWHRPSDTAAGVLLVLAWGALAVFGIRLWRLRAAGGPARPSRIATVPLLTAGALTAVGGTLGMGLVAVSQRVGSDLVSGQFAFLAGSVVSAAAVTLAFLAWTFLAND